MDEVRHKDDRRHYLRVRVQKAPPGAEGVDVGGYRAYLTGGQGSGILTSMVLANGVAIIPEDWDHVAAGTPVRVIMLDWE